MIVACNNDPDTTPDAGNTPDGGTPDGSVQQDAVVDDSSVVDDMGATLDASTELDGSTELDATTSDDASIDTDGGNLCEFANSLDGSCSVDEDCRILVHQFNCCGDTVAIGVNLAQSESAAADEVICRDTYPHCGCPTHQTTTDSGESVAFGSEANVACVSRGATAVCLTYVSMRPADGA